LKNCRRGGRLADKSTERGAARHRAIRKATLQGSILPTGSPLNAPALGILIDPRHIELVGAAQIQLSL
jgi:hypothetical protein